MAEGVTREEPPNAPPSVASRLFVTIALPLVLLAAGAYVSLPGVPEMVTHVSRASGSARTTGVFALGIMPILNAFWLVEVVAFLVPSLSRLRHHPDGRAKLDRASRVLAIVLAALQGWGIATNLQALAYGVEMRGADIGPVSAPVVASTLVAGACVQMLAAELISRRGLFNGYLVLFGAGGVVTLGEDAKKLFFAGGGLDGVPVGRLALAFFSAACVVAATLVALRGAAHVRAKTAPGEEHAGAPYRAARALSLSPVLPIPSSSFQPFSSALTLVVGVPAVFAALDPRVGALGRDAAVVPALLVTTCALAVVFARLLHRPKELASLVEQVGAKAGDAFDAEMKDARREALLPTLLFFFALIAAYPTATFGVVLVVPIVAIAMDAIHALRTTSKVPVWEERRVAAVPLLRAVLAAEGIATETRGAATATLWQVFAPYAPVEILVDASDVVPARALLRHFVAGDPSPDRSSGRAPVTYGAPPWPAKRRAVALGACVVLAVAGWAAHAMPSRADATPRGPRAVLEVVRIDDTVDPLAGFDLSASEIDVRSETVEVGPGRPRETTHYAFLPLGGRTQQESAATAEQRLRKALAEIPLGPNRRFGIETTSFGADSPRNGLRTYLLTGSSAIAPDDIVDARAMRDPVTGEAYVEITLGPEGARRFEGLTREWRRRRVALLVDGHVNSAPIIAEPISGGKLSLMVGRGQDEDRGAEAKRLARALGGR